MDPRKRPCLNLEHIYTLYVVEVSAEATLASLVYGKSEYF